jgi:hypothetical protein
MTFKEKIDKILEFNKLEINSVSGLEDFLKASRSSINDFYNSNQEPGRKTLKRIKSLPALNWEWYETGKGDVFKENSTLAIKNDQPAVNETLPEIKNPNREIEILLNSLEQFGNTNAYLLKRVKELEDLLNGGQSNPTPV